MNRSRPPRQAPEGRANGSKLIPPDGTDEIGPAYYALFMTCFEWSRIIDERRAEKARNATNEMPD